ncbi:ATP-binding protein [Ktedonobacter sp. SOSP1-85]|uniref:NACHT domain-containing protein n=1 Tax=Ktedonobacter sp. SOSP1-85 TaxID=2778367 RepID=UPI0019165937|nr:NACHT domain-containing protein [Ktedonobacter sp. SOSP1-85]GHO78572.1 ATP-binding protein [Ktedonobacter sp. SOSP1-85]
MPLLEILMLDVGGAIAKGLLTRWLSSNALVSDVASSLTDVLKTQISDRLAQQRARQQLETIGEKVGESLVPIFEIEGAALDESSRAAIANAVADTLNTANSALLARHNLEPVEIARELLKEHPASSYHFSQSEGYLYERIVNESCQYIVDIASQLPQFTERTLSEVLLRERQLVKTAERIVDEVTRLRQQLNPQVEAKRFELDYCRTVIRKLDELELFGSGMSVTARKYSLSLSYVAPSLEYEVLRPPQEHEKFRHRDPNLAPKSQLVRTVVEAPKLLAESSYLLLRGDAGSGKTTLMRWIAVQAASQCFPPELASWNGLVPFFIRLRRHVRLEDGGVPYWPAPEDFPGLVAPAIAGAMPQGWVHRQLQDGRAIVLIDGIDEVPGAMRESVYTWLADLLESYPASRFIVTSRPYAASKDDLPPSEQLKEAQVLPRSPAAIEDFITHWHDAIAANLQDAQEKQDLRASATRLVAEIRDNHALQQLANSPILCAMLCALNREWRQQLPSNRVALYEACCELLIERRDRVRRISLVDYPAAVLSYEQKSLLLSDLAYWLVRNGQTEASIETVDERLTRRLGRMLGVPDNLQGADARQLFIERSGILREPVKDALDFTHRTFQEYLAAKAVVDENDIPLLVEHAHDDQWREVVLLTVGLAPRTVRENLVERLLKRAETRKRVREKLYLLAAACTQVAHEEMKPEIQARISQGLATLVPFQSVEEVESMSAAGTLGIPHLAPRFEYSSYIVAACVRVLLQIGTEAAYEALMAYTKDDTNRVIGALVLGLKGVIDKPAYAQRFLAHVKSAVASSETFELLPWLPHLTSLELLWDLTVLESLPGLTSLELFDLDEVRDLTVLERLPGLTSLKLSSLPGLRDLTVLERLPGLTSLELFDLREVSNLTVLERLPGLTSLKLSVLHEVREITVLERLPGLTSLELSGLPQVRDLTVLERLPGLTSLELSALPQVRDLTVVEQFSELTSLKLSYLDKVGDLTVLERLPELTSLELSYLDKVRDLTVLERLPELTSLELSGLGEIRDLTILEKLPLLTSLSLSDFPELADLSGLERLPRLTSLDLYNLPKVNDFTVLERLEKLESITIGLLDSRSVFPQGVLKRVRIKRLR